MVRYAHFLGRLTKDIELKYTTNGKAVGNFSMAINEKYKDKEETHYFDFVIWAKGAEVLASCVGKGERLFVECKPEIQSWDNKEGVKQQRCVFNVQKFSFIDEKKKQENRESQNDFNVGKQAEFASDSIPF